MNFKLLLTIVFGAHLMSCSTLNKNEFKGITYKDLELNTFNFEDINSPSYTKAQFEQDINLLRFAILKAYGARNTLPESLFKNVDSELKQINYISDSEKLCYKLGEILSKFPDHHLKVKFNRKNCFKMKINYVDVGKNLNNLKDKPWKGIIKSNVYIAAITRFPSGDWPGFLDFINKAKKNAKALIIDLRGNGGGDDSISYKMVELLAEQKTQTPFAPSVHRNSPETLTIWKNNLNLMKAYFKDENTSKKLDEYIVKTEKKLKLALKNEIKEFTLEEDENNGAASYNKEKGFQNPIYILQDKVTASSGESTIDLFEYFPNVTKVGYNTAGMLQFGNVGWLELSHTKLQIQMPTKANKYKDGRFIEFTGIKPDIVLNEGQDAYEYVIKNLIK